MFLEGKATQIAIGQIRGYLKPSKAERAAAFELFVELSVRVTTPSIDDERGTLRDEVGHARVVDDLRGGEVDAQRRVAALAAHLEVVRARHARDRDAARLCHSSTIAGLPCRRHYGDGRGPAAQSREIGNGRVVPLWQDGCNSSTNSNRDSHSVAS